VNQWDIDELREAFSTVDDPMKRCYKIIRIAKDIKDNLERGCSDDLVYELLNEIIYNTAKKESNAMHQHNLKEFWK